MAETRYTYMTVAEKREYHREKQQGYKDKRRKYQRAYYRAHREKAKAYQRNYNKTHPKKKRHNTLRSEGYIRWLLVSARSGACMGIKYRYKNDGPKFKHQREDVPMYTASDFMALHDDKIGRIANLIIDGERLLTM